MGNASLVLKTEQPAMVNGVQGAYVTVDFVAENGHQETQGYFVPNAENTVLEDALAHFNESALALKSETEEEFFYTPQVEPKESVE